MKCSLSFSSSPAWRRWLPGSILGVAACTLLTRGNSRWDSHEPVPGAPLVPSRRGAPGAASRRLGGLAGYLDPRTVTPRDGAASDPPRGAIAADGGGAPAPGATRDETRARAEYCVAHRGASGHWFVNETLGRQTFYRHGYRANAFWRKHGTDPTAVYQGNVYAWNDSTTRDGGDARPRPTPSCAPIQPLTRALFCRVARRLHIRRIMFVGDSLMGSQQESFFGLLGGTSAAMWGKKTRRRPDDKVECRGDGDGNGEHVEDYNFVVDAKFHRESLGPNVAPANVTGREDATRQHRQQFGPEPIGCGNKQGEKEGYACPWYASYRDEAPTAGGRTLLVTNQGAHFHSRRSFRSSMRAFADAFGPLLHPDDLLFFRSTVPGHVDCWGRQDVLARVGGIPGMTHDVFLREFATSRYDWNLFDDYNGLARDALAVMRQRHGLKNLQYLNVYNMTVLRSDGHVSPEDCLHYMPVGPVDYWNHLLFTNLDELAAAAAASTAYP